MIGKVFIRANSLASMLVGLSLLLTCSCSTGKRVELTSLDLELSPLLDTTPYRDTFTTSDGRELGFVRYQAENEKADIAIVYLHGIESHAGWFMLASQTLQQKGYDVYCMDRRGSGINRENRGFISGYVDSYQVLFDDIETFIKPLRKRYRKVILTGLSWGGRLATAYAIHRTETIDGLVLITPGIKADVDVSFYAKIQIVLGVLFNPTAAMKLPIETEMFTHTEEFLELMRNDPLRLHSASARFLIESVKLEGYIESNIKKLQIPMLLILTENDDIIDNEGVSLVLGHAWRSPLVRLFYEKQIHSVEFDAVPRLAEDMDSWIEYVTESD